MMFNSELSESMCYMMFIRVAQVSSFLAAGFVSGANVWICQQMGPHVSSMNDVFSMFIPIYNVILGQLIMVSLFDFQWIATYSYFLLTYFGSGLFQMFVGILTLGTSSAYTSVTSAAGAYSNTVEIVRLVAGWILASVGAIYILMGLLQFPHLSKRRKFLEISRNSLPSHLGSAERV